MGANQNIDEVSKNLNIDRGNAIGFAANSAGMKKASLTVTKGLTSYYSSRRSGETSIKSFYDNGSDNK
jgi:hypothetical protein